MSTQAGFALRGRNPDVLTCIANLSNDEVFTPPEFANQMLDTLAEAWAADHGGAELWADKTVKFLDPFTKSGVFLREIPAVAIFPRVLRALEPDVAVITVQPLGDRVLAVGVLRAINAAPCQQAGEIRDADTEHLLGQDVIDALSEVRNLGSQSFRKAASDCAASQKTFERGEALETHAYVFIHTDDIKARIAELFGGDMQFDVNHRQTSLSICPDMSRSRP